MTGRECWDMSTIDGTHSISEIWPELCGGLYLLWDCIGVVERNNVCCVEWQQGKYSDYFSEVYMKRNQLSTIHIVQCTMISYHSLAEIAPQCASQEDPWHMCRGKWQAVLLTTQTLSFCGCNFWESIWGDWRRLHVPLAHCRYILGGLWGVPRPILH